MRIRIGFDIGFTSANPIPLIVMLNVHPSRWDDLVAPDVIRTSTGTPLSFYRDGFGNVCGRLVAPPGEIVLSCLTDIRDSGLPDVLAPGAQQLPIEMLPDETLIYLLGSRYCDTEHLSDMAWQTFGSTAPGWPRVQAICDFVHNHLTFGYHFARPTRSAHEAYTERQGVCRDFAHLAITLCRCMNIPARYCTGYLGDIGVPPMDAPMDFSAWFEVYLSGTWYTFDARHNTPRIGRVLMARGRDAADVALSTSFGQTTLSTFKVYTDEVVGA